MIEVKVCGITNSADARTAADCGANALGFIFYPKSPRYVTPARAQWIIDQLPKSLIRVGVFVNQPADEILALARICALHLIQLHGDETPEFCRRFPASRLIKAFAPRHENDLLILKAYRVRGWLIDARRPGVFGGTGARADWALARKAGEVHPLLLAGGLGEDCIREALQIVKPRALDLNSGLESCPGEKDPEKVRRVMEIIRNLRPRAHPSSITPFFGSDLLTTRNPWEQGKKPDHDSNQPLFQ
jgi:phosphoribosylanthranilate isomerase